MNRMDRILNNAKLTPQAIEELKDANSVLREMRSLSVTASSEGGIELRKSLKADASTILVSLINGFKTMPEYELRGSIAEFAATFKMFQTLSHAADDYHEARDNAEFRMEQILEQEGIDEDSIEEGENEG